MSVVIVLAVLALAGCTGRSGDAERTELGEGGEIRIGVLAPLSGPGSATGQDAARGAELAAELINNGALPLLSGMTLPGDTQVTITTGDTRGEPDVGVSSAARLVAEERVVGLIGAGGPVVMAAASQRTERLGVPFIGTDTPDSFLTERGLAWFFRTGPTERALAATLFSALRQEARRDPAARRVAIVHTAARGASDLATLLSDVGDEGGFGVTDVVVDLAAQGAADEATDEALEKVRSAQAGAVFLVALTPDEARRLVARFHGLAGPIAMLGFGPGFADPAALAVAARGASGLLSTTSWSHALAERSSAAQPVLRAYAERHGKPMSEAAANAFTAVQGLVEAVGRAGSTDPGQIRPALLGLNLFGRSTIMPWQGIRFDATGQNVHALGIVEQRIGRSVRVVFPPGVANGNVLTLDEASR